MLSPAHKSERERSVDDSSSDSYKSSSNENSSANTFTHNPQYHHNEDMKLNTGN
jgi:hypothetical protein